MANKKERIRPNGQISSFANSNLMNLSSAYLKKKSRENKKFAGLHNFFGCICRKFKRYLIILSQVIERLTIKSQA
jgi:hypothetical protein